MTVPGRDLTRADARDAINETKRALGGLHHIAVAGMLNEGEDLIARMSGLVATRDLIVHLIDDILGRFALQLPEEET